MSFLQNIQDKLRPKPAVITGDGTLNEAAVRAALSQVIDPDLHKDIVTLGFVQDIRITGGAVKVTVELTTPACPVKEELKKQCQTALEKIPGVTSADVTITAKTRGPQLAKPEVSQSLGRIKNIVAVASGKGGVGKSTSAVNLAYALAKTGALVGILDADVYGPSIPLMTKVGAPEQSRDGMILPPKINGIKMISVSMFGSANKAAILRGPMAGQIIKQFLTQVAWEDLDYLIIDYPPGTGDIQLTLSQAAPITGAVIITTPQEVALIDVRKAINMFATLKVPVLGIIETMSYFVCDGCDKRHEIFRAGGGARLAGETGLALLGEIPIDPRVTVGSDEGKPIVTSDENAPAAQAYMAAAGKTAAQLSILHAQDKGVLDHFSVVWN